MSDESVAESGRTALRVLAVVLLVLVVAPFVVTGVPSIIGAEESFVVLSGSMNAEPEPIIQPGDVVIVDGVNPANIEEQDIITFGTGADEPVTHRVVNVTEQDGQVAFRTKGDANEDADQQLIGPDQVVGEVILVIPLIGHVVNFANTTEGFVLLVLLPIGLLVLSEVWNLLLSAGGSSTDESDEPTAAETAAAVGPEMDADEGEDRPTVSLRRVHVGWAAVGLVPVAVAAGYASFRLQSAWVITVTYASVGLFVLSVLLYWRMGWEASMAQETSRAAQSSNGRTEPTEQATAGEVHEEVGTARSTSVATVRPVVEDGRRRDPVVTGQLADGVDTDSHVEVAVDSREELVDMAIEKESWVVHDPDVETYFLVDGGMLFRYDDGEGPTRPADSSADTNGTGIDEAASEWDEAAGWVSFSATDGTETAASETGTSNRSAGELTPVVESVDSRPSSTVATNGDGLSAVWEDEEVTSAIRRIDAPDETEEMADASDAPQPSDESEEVAETSEPAEEGEEPVAVDRAATDGGTTTESPLLVRAVGRVVSIPVRMLGFLGYLVVAPPMALYRLVRPGRGNTNDSQTEEAKEER